MSGWIKVEKALETDPRTLRMAKALAKRFQFMTVSVGADSGVCNAIALPTVTLVCGALTRLWIYADSHIREDNTLDMTSAEIDEWLGLPGFCSLMPADWLVQVDDNSVELPGFLDHNGVEAKRKALGAKRVENHRIRNTVTPCNAPALPDQTRPDQTKTIQEAREIVPRETDSEIRAHIDRIKADYPKAARQDWITAEKLIRNLVLHGTPWDFIHAGVGRYRKLCDATNRQAQNPAMFFGAIDEPWLQEWPLPAVNQKSGAASAPNHDAAWAEAKARAKAIGFRDPHPADTAQSYMTDVKRAETTPPSVPLAERRGLAGIKRIGAT